MSRFKMHIMITFIIAMIQRNMAGYAIGGLSGGEEKDIFWRMVSVCTDMLPREKPCYLMGVGYAPCVLYVCLSPVWLDGTRFAVDLVVCSALGVDMYDCVFPTRTAVSVSFCS